MTTEILEEGQGRFRLDELSENEQALWRCFTSSPKLVHSALTLMNGCPKAWEQVREYFERRETMENQRLPLAEASVLIDKFRQGYDVVYRQIDESFRPFLDDVIGAVAKNFSKINLL